MILKTEEHQEVHPNGKIWIAGQIGIIAPSWKHLYDYRSEGQDGQIWCRQGVWTKHYDNSQLAWTIEYDQYGRYIKKDYPQYRQDGTIIIN